MKENYFKFSLLLLFCALILNNVSAFANFSSIAARTGVIPYEHNVSLCSAPASQPTSLTFIAPLSTIAWGSFTSTTADEYLVVVSTSATLTASPVSGTVYTVGNTIGNARVVSIGSSRIFAAFGLNPSTTYHFSVFALNSIGCTGGPAYLTTNPLSGSVTTKALPNDIPAAQPTSLVFVSATATTISGSFTSAAATGYLVTVSSSATLTATPIDKNDYTVGSVIGNATVISSGATTSFSATGLSSSTPYYISVFSYYADPSCNCGRIYRTISPLTGSSSTLAPACTTPSAQPSALVFDTPSSTGISASFTATTADEYLVVYSTSASLTALPVNGTTYNSGAAFGNGTVLSRSASTTFSASGLSTSTAYYFYVFALNNASCSAGPAYKTSSPLTGSIATLAPPCIAPENSPTALVFETPTSSTISGSFTAASADSYLVLYSTSASLTSLPVNATVYTPGDTVGNATVLSSGSSTSFSASSLSVSTTYYITVFPSNNSACSPGPVSKTSTPLSGSVTTLAAHCVTPSNSPTALI
ncbi:MAG TPA: hypothetical protein VK476_04810, partial [Flavobacterium sp.]|nr:hypothetical protein [Flavobacterium sp.]